MYLLWLYWRWWVCRAGGPHSQQTHNQQLALRLAASSPNPGPARRGDTAQPYRRPGSALQRACASTLAAGFPVYLRPRCIQPRLARQLRSRRLRSATRNLRRPLQLPQQVNNPLPGGHSLAASLSVAHG